MFRKLDGMFGVVKVYGLFRDVDLNYWLEIRMY